MMLKYIKMFVVGVLLPWSGQCTNNYVEGAHTLICDLLKAAVAQYEFVKSSEGPLKGALEKTIFGKNVASKRISELSFPDDYNPAGNIQNKEPNTRKNWCGKCGNSSQWHHPGESAPHDLLCLCTPGQNGHPISGALDKRLCGKAGGELVSSGKQGWHTELFKDEDKGKDQIKLAWDVAVTPCLQGGDGTNLETAIKKFKDNLHNAGGQYLGEQGKDYACGGAPGDGVCVRYCTSEPNYKPWWRELEEAIPKQKHWEERQRKHEEDKKDKLKKPKGLQNSPEKKAQTPQLIPRVSQPPQTKETSDQQKAEQLISNITSTDEKNVSFLNLPKGLLLATLFI